MSISSRHLRIRCAVWAVSAAFAAALAFVWTLCLPQAAFAYVDPSVMTYTIQALAGVAVALSAVAGVVFRRIRRKLFAAFNIDENTNKAREGAIALIDPESARAEELFADADVRAERLVAESAKTADARGIENLTWKKRFAFALLMCFFMFFIVLVAPAMEIFGANTDSLVFGLDSVWWVSALINGILAVACAFVISALKGKRFLICLLVVFCLGAAAYVQAFFLNAGMMPADGGFIGWTEWYFVQKMIVSGIVWLAIFIVPLTLSRHHRYAWLKGTSIVAVAIIIMQGAGVASAFADYHESAAKGDHPYVTQGGFFTLNPENNVVVFVLDTYDTAILDQALVDDPHVLDNFTDFTYFRNSSGTMIPTQYAVPYMLSGNKPKPDQALGEYMGNRYEGTTFLPTLSDKGYTLGLYTDSAMFNYNNPTDVALAQSTLNIHPMDSLPLDVWQTWLVMNQCALYREAPWVLKPAFWYYTTEVNNRMIADTESDDGNDVLYELDDAAILESLREHKLSAIDEAGSGAFRFIHLFGPHFPFSMDENGNDIGVGRSDKERQALGTLKVVDEYIQQMKQLGLYDQAPIIVTADHGEWSEREDPPSRAICPIMLVKPSMPQGGTGQPYVISEAPVDHDDILPTIAWAIGADPSQFGSGITVWETGEGRPPRTFDAITSAGPGGRRMVEYWIEGDAMDVNNWKKTGHEWPGA